MGNAQVRQGFSDHFHGPAQRVRALACVILLAVSVPAAWVEAQEAPRPSSQVDASSSEVEDSAADQPSGKPAARPDTLLDEAQQGPTEQISATAPKPKRGSVTNLPLPRFVSLKAATANARRGPSLSHRIDWVFGLRGYPLEVIAEYGHWRRVRDFEDATGWVHYTLISGVRTVLALEDIVDLHGQPDLSSRLTAQAEKGAVLRLLKCSLEWCQVNADGYKGWAKKSAIWGVRADEIID